MSVVGDIRKRSLYLENISYWNIYRARTGSVRMEPYACVDSSYHPQLMRICWKIYTNIHRISCVKVISEIDLYFVQIGILGVDKIDNLPDKELYKSVFIHQHLWQNGTWNIKLLLRFFARVNDTKNMKNQQLNLINCNLNWNNGIQYFIFKKLKFIAHIAVS